MLTPELRTTDSRPRARRGEYSRSAGTGARKSRSARGRGSVSRRLRAIYFSGASVWGFLVGAGVLIVALREPDDSPPGLLQWLIILAGAVVAVGGGLVAAAAYREARRRMR